MSNTRPENMSEENIFSEELLGLEFNPLLNLMFSSINDGILIADAQCFVRYVNDAYCRITGINKLDILHNKVGEIRKGAKLPIAIETGKTLKGLKRKVKDIEYIADVQPIIINDHIIGGISILRDITEVARLSKNFQMYSRKVKEIHKANYTLDNIIGKSRVLENLKGLINRISASDAAVLIRGESGTGKELFAHAIHNRSSRSDSPFVAINCAAFPSSLLISELFGYEEGSFTGAQKGGKLGLFEIANGGTLFLDEIGDMEFELQSKILRVLESGEFIKIGGTTSITVDVRIISATNKDLETLIADKLFREDLFYRLNVVPIDVPPLRIRPEDIPLLIDHYLKKFSLKFNRTYSMSDNALAVLSSYGFPGNVRELVNILEFTVNTCESSIIGVEDLPVFKSKDNSRRLLSSAISNSEKETIVEILSKFDNSVTGKKRAAAELGISLATLYNKINQYGLSQRN